MANTRFFFIVGMGRSGTLFLSHLLNKIACCSVYHEMERDRNALVNAYWNADKSKQYLAGYRARIIAARILRNRKPVYGEVNSYLRFHVDALQERWHPVILHLVRDGRDVVRSLMNRKVFTEADKTHTGRLGPRPGDPFAIDWDRQDRFFKVCWYWAATNRELLEHRLQIVRFEDVTRSYREFCEQLLRPLDLYLSNEIWEDKVSKPRNVSRTKSFPAWEGWTEQEKQQFVDICGPVMSSLGYGL